LADSAVRQAFRDRLATLEPGLPYYETLNSYPPFLLDPGADEANAPAIWSTLSFPQSSVERRSIGAAPTCWRETGIVYVHVLGIAGQGDTDVMAAVEQVRAAFWDAQLTPEIRVASVDPAAHNQPDSGNWFEALVPVSYFHDFYQ
jgi:hypothetical protein